MTRKDSELSERIHAALKDKDVSWAHVLLHSLARIYNHTPYPVRLERLKNFPEFACLATACLKGCSQTGKDSVPRDVKRGKENAK